MLCKINGKFYKFVWWLPFYFLFRSRLKPQKEKLVEEKSSGVSKEFMTAIFTIIGLFALFVAAYSVSQWSLLLGVFAFLAFSVFCLVSLTRGVIFLARTVYTFIKGLIISAIRIFKKVWSFKITLYRINNRWL